MARNERDKNNDLAIEGLRTMVQSVLAEATRLAECAESTVEHFGEEMGSLIEKHAAGGGVTVDEMLAASGRVDVARIDWNNKTDRVEHLERALKELSTAFECR